MEAIKLGLAQMAPRVRIRDRIWNFYQTRPYSACVYTVAVLILLRFLLSEVPGSAPLRLAAVAAILTKALTLIIIALPFQLLFPGVGRDPKVFTYEFWLDLLYWHQGLLLSLVSFWAVVSVASKFLWSWASGPWLPFVAELPYWAQVLLAIWLYDFLVYWRHRAEHVFRPLWSFHAVHHSTRQVDVLTTLRLHPLELMLGSICNAAVAFIGIDPAAVGTGFMIYMYWNYFIHTNVRVRFPGPLKYILVSPFMHQWHHALDRAAIGKNVGVVFAWNDWLFKSAYHPPHWPTEFGIDVPVSERMPQSYLRQLLYPLQYLWAQTLGARAAPPKESVTG